MQGYKFVHLTCDMYLLYMINASCLLHVHPSPTFSLHKVSFSLNVGSSEQVPHFTRIPRLQQATSEQ